MNPLECKKQENGASDAQPSFELPFVMTGTVTAVPEPSTYALMLAGAVAVVGAARRRAAKV